MRRLKLNVGHLPLGLVVLSLLLIGAGCASLTRSWIAPEVMVTSLKPQQIALTEQLLLVGLKIHNPNDRTLPIKAMTYRLYLEGDEIATGGGTLERQIPALGDASVEVSVVASALALAGKLPTLALQSRPWAYRISGTVTVAGVVPIPYRYSGEIDPRELVGARGL